MKTHAWFTVAGDINLPPKRSATLRTFIQMTAAGSGTTHTHTENALLCFYDSSDYTTAPHCYAIRTLLILF
jgi:hypothetical protein